MLRDAHFCTFLEVFHNSPISNSTTIECCSVHHSQANNVLADIQQTSCNETSCDRAASYTQKNTKKPIYNIFAMRYLLRLTNKSIQFILQFFQVSPLFFIITFPIQSDWNRHDLVCSWFNKWFRSEKTLVTVRLTSMKSTFLTELFNTCNG